MGHLPAKQSNGGTVPTTASAPAQTRSQQIFTALGKRAAELDALLGAGMADRFRRAAAAHYDAMASADAKARERMDAVDVRSYVAACMDAALDGLTPDGREGWILVRKGVAAWTISWRGMVKLARRANRMREFTAEIVYQEEIERGGFIVDLAARTIVHRPWYTLGVAAEPADDHIVLAYAAATIVHDDGTTTREFRILPHSELLARARASGNPYDDMPSTTWVKWQKPMMRKAVTRAFLDYLPTPDRVWESIHREDDRVSQLGGEPRMLAPVPTLAGELAASVRGQIAAAPPIDTDAREPDAPRPAGDDPDPHSAIAGGE